MTNIIPFLFATLFACTFSFCHKPTMSPSDPWSKISSPFEGQQLRAIQFVSQDTGYILGLNIETTNRYNALLQSTDGGKTWQQQIFPLPEPGGVGTLFAYSSHLIFSAGDGIFKSTDGGISWSKTDSSFNSKGNLTRGIHFFDSQNGMVINGGEVYKTIDGGNHFFVVLHDPSGSALKSLHVVSNTIFSGGGTGDLFRSIDQGNTWNRFVHNSSMAMSFINERTGYGLLFQDIYKTSDGGITWVKINEEPVGNNAASKLLFINGNQGFIITVSGEIYYTGNGGKNWKIEHTDALQLNDIATNGNNEIFVVGEKDLILSRKLN